jgi:hypothetical protein
MPVLLQLKLTIHYRAELRDSIGQNAAARCLPLSASYFVSRSTIATALTVRRTSSSLVCQLQTLTRIALMPRQVVAVKNASPVAAMAAITSSVRW